MQIVEIVLQVNNKNGLFPPDDLCININSGVKKTYFDGVFLRFKIQSL
jgi:hypothetical protein